MYMWVVVWACLAQPPRSGKMFPLCIGRAHESVWDVLPCSREKARSWLSFVRVGVYLTARRRASIQLALWERAVDDPSLSPTAGLVRLERH